MSGLAPELPDRIRAACASVVERARSVSLREEPLAKLAARLAGAQPPAQPLDPAHHFRSDPESTLAYVVALERIQRAPFPPRVVPARKACSRSGGTGAAAERTSPSDSRAEKSAGLAVAIAT